MFRSMAMAALLVASIFLLLPPGAIAQVDPPDPPETCSVEGEGSCTQDDNLCTEEQCNTESGQCESVPVTCAVDDNLCTIEACNPENGRCESTPVTCNGGEGGIDNGDSCTVGVCNPNTGQCEGIPVTCEQDDNPCTIEACNPESGQCQSTPVVCEQDDNLCTVEACVPELGRCETVTGEECSQDDDPCTTHVCSPSSGECVANPTNPPPDVCEGAICRTAGFWGSHGGTEKRRSQDITLATIVAGGGSLSICGESITSTIVSDNESALEALCVSVRGEQRLQLARQLTAAALNCVISNGDPGCSGTPLFAGIFSSCNITCASSGSSSSAITSCIADLDCLNNGGRVLSNGFCQTGTCSGGPETPCNAASGCPEEASCIPLPGTCHEQGLVNEFLGLNFQPPGPAGSSRGCSQATGNACVVIGVGQLNCAM